MKSLLLPSRIDRFPIIHETSLRASAVIPTVKGKWHMKYGEHAHYFMNFLSSRGLCARLSHRDIMRPGWKRLEQAASKYGISFRWARLLAPAYHYHFNLLEQVMLMTVPHTVTPLGGGRFIINLWSWCGYLLFDCNDKTVTYHIIDDSNNDSVLGSQQWYDPGDDSLYAMSYSLSDSLGRIDDPSRQVAFTIFKHRHGDAGKQTIWEGALSDYMHDIIINENRTFCVACELGMHLDSEKNILPSKVLIIDLKNHKEWILDRFIVAAHACFDPENPNVIYFSNHNFEFQHSSLIQLMKKGSYSVKFRGAASVFKYELTHDGPREIGVFTRDDFYRLTNMHVFMHRKRKIIAAMGFPDEIFLIDADDMNFIRKIHVRDPVSLKRLYSRKPALIGTIAPSPDGEKLLVQTTGSFQVIDISTGEPEYVRDYFFSHICFNHMIASNDTDW